MPADSTLNVLTSGPYGVIFSSFVPFYLDIPVSTRFRVFGLRFTDKSFIYLAGLQVSKILIWYMGEFIMHKILFASVRIITLVCILQLLLSSWKRSILPGICGILAGALYRLNVLHIRRLKVRTCFVTFMNLYTLLFSICPLLLTQFTYLPCKLCWLGACWICLGRTWVLSLLLRS